MIQSIHPTIPSSWEQATVGELGKVEYGKSLVKRERVETGTVEVYGSAGLVGYHDQALLEEPVIVVGRKGSAGKVWLTNGPSWPIDTTYFFRPPKELSIKYLAFQLSNLNLVQMDTSTTIPSLRRSDLEAVPLFIAPRSEQERIVSSIEDILLKLDIIKNSIQIVMHQASMLRRSVLVKAFSGRLVPQDTSEKPARYLIKDMSVLKPLTMQRLKHGPLPIGWEKVAIGQVCEVIGGATPNTSVNEYWGGSISWLTPDDLSGHSVKYISHGRRSLTLEGYKSCSAKILPPGTVLFTSRAPIGYVAILSEHACTNQGFKSFIPTKGISSSYIYWYFHHTKELIRELGSGTTFKEISKKIAIRIPLLLAPTNEQIRIVEGIEKVFVRLDKMEALLLSLLNKIQIAKRSILSEAFVGRLVPQDSKEEPASVLLDRMAATQDLEEKVVGG